MCRHSLCGEITLDFNTPLYSTMKPTGIVVLLIHQKRDELVQHDCKRESIQHLTHFRKSIFLGISLSLFLIIHIWNSFSLDDFRKRCGLLNYFRNCTLDNVNSNHSAILMIMAELFINDLSTTVLLHSKCFFFL